MVPLLMARRFQNQMFDNIKNGLGLSVTDYLNPDNFVMMRAIPYLDVENIKNVFEDSFNVFDAGKIMQSGRFSYTHCVVDLNPDVNEYNEGVENKMLKLEADKFPVSFQNGVDVNADDTYKKSKIVLTRVEPISAANFDTATIGSKTTDYDLVTNETKIKYSDDESILGGAVDDVANVVLGNGGSFQKKRVDVDLNQFDKSGSIDGYEPTEDFYNIYVDRRDKNGKRRAIADINGKHQGDTGWIPTYEQKRKYFKNKHFFIDPFELTIAQWCHAHGKHTKHSAIQLIGEYGGSPARFSDSGKEKLREMAKSFWKYLMVWEHDLFAEKKSASPYSGDTDDKYLEVLNREADSMCDDYRTSRDYEYDPLEDIRPYYYATYQNVRGTS
jgi:hypothetical protein